MTIASRRPACRAPRGRAAARWRARGRPSLPGGGCSIGVRYALFVEPRSTPPVSLGLRRVPPVAVGHQHLAVGREDEGRVVRVRRRRPRRRTSGPARRDRAAGRRGAGSSASSTRRAGAMLARGREVHAVLHGEVAEGLVEAAIERVGGREDEIPHQRAAGILAGVVRELRPRRCRAGSRSRRRRSSAARAGGPAAADERRDQPGVLRGRRRGRGPVPRDRRDEMAGDVADAGLHEAAPGRVGRIHQGAILSRTLVAAASPSRCWCRARRCEPARRPRDAQHEQAASRHRSRRSVRGTLPAARAAWAGEAVRPSVPAPTSTIEGPARSAKEVPVSAPPHRSTPRSSLGAQIEARAAIRSVAGGAFLLRQDDGAWTYRQYRDECVRLAHFLARRLGPIDDARPGHVAMLAREPPRAARALRRLRLRGRDAVRRQHGSARRRRSPACSTSRARACSSSTSGFAARSSACAAQLAHVAPENVLVLRTDAPAPLDGARPDGRGRARGRAARALARHARRRRRPDDAADGHLHLGHDRPAEGHHQQPLQAARDRHGRVAATCGSDATTSATRACRSSTRTRMFLGFQPAFHGRRQRSRCASASAPVELRARRAPLRRHLLELRRRAGALRARRDREGVRRRRGAHPRRGRRTTRGTGCATRSATAPPRPTSSASSTWLGLEDMFELYGSTEAAISTFRKKGDPRGSRRRDHRPGRARS